MKKIFTHSVILAIVSYLLVAAFGWMSLVAVGLIYWLVFTNSGYKFLQEHTPFLDL